MAVLVTYASAHGSTREIAERIAGRLGERGLEVDVLPVDEGVDAGEYDAVVLGSAIHDQAWLPEATAFVDRDLDALAARPVWLFSVGMPGALAGPWRDVAKKEAAIVVAGFRDAVGPREHRLFSGVVRREHLPRRGRLASGRSAAGTATSGTGTRSTPGPGTSPGSWRPRRATVAEPTPDRAGRPSRLLRSLAASG